MLLEETQTLDDGGLFMTPSQRAVSATGTLSTPWSNAPSEWNTPRIPPNNRRLRSFSTAGPPTVVYPQTNVMGWRTWGEPIPMTPAQSQYHLAPVTTLSVSNNSEILIRLKKIITYSRRYLKQNYLH